LQNFTSFEDAVNYLDTISYDVVIKADGLAAGKGVIIPTSKEEAREALHDIMVKKIFDDSGMGQFLRTKVRERGRDRGISGGR
jgi:phosphoribosylamine--glycine ligase / phosphoribosylformylglycinamidine cyclo-ligase